uniref:Si:dkey-243i1.1 n=1 Tax=Seriola dumerili TaxID=41447 RepID=A0A3B4UCF6_SERDU
YNLSENSGKCSSLFPETQLNIFYVSNRATHVRLPAPIVIEKLMPLSEERENMDSTRSSTSFTVLSEERLQAAIKLAKRDLRRRRLESLIKSPTIKTIIVYPFKSYTRDLCHFIQSDRKQTSQKRPICRMPRAGQSPPTRDNGLRQLDGGKPGPLSQEIHKLQNELEVYIQKVEELANREEPLEPEEQNKLEIRRQKQAARSARSIYVLQQQVKEIQDDIEKLRSQKMWDTKKSTAINRLAAAHRGAQRALQVVIHQLSDLSHSKVPPHYKELGQLIRQLSLCSAKVQVDQGSAVPETALDILQKLEVRSIKYNQNMFNFSFVTAGWRMASQKPKTTSQQPINRREVLRVGLESLVQQRELRELRGRPQTNTSCRKGLHSERRKIDIIMKVLTLTVPEVKTKLPCEKNLNIDFVILFSQGNQMQDAGFQQPTVSSRLRVNELPQKERSVPWIPTSPHSPPPQREALLEDLLEDTARAAWAAETDRQLEGMAQCRLQAPTLESMLLRMEEIQVRAALQKDPVSEIYLLCFHTNSFLSESSLIEEASQDEQQPTNSTVFPSPAEKSMGTRISVPGSMLRNVRQYREDYEAYLRVVAHEAVGSFNPWAIANSLAEELLSEALTDVAAEFQDVVEEYAEAVFTSEFLQPTQAPPAPTAALVSQ